MQFPPVNLFLSNFLHNCVEHKDMSPFHISSRIPHSKLSFITSYYKSLIYLPHKTSYTLLGQHSSTNNTHNQSCDSCVRRYSTMFEIFPTTIYSCLSLYDPQFFQTKCVFPMYFIHYIYMLFQKLLDTKCVRIFRRVK